MNETDPQLNQKLENLEREMAGLRKELEKKEDRPDKIRKYISWLVMGMIVIGFYAAYYFYVMSLF